MLEFGLPVPHALRQVEGPHLLADDLGMEERFGFERHLPGDRVCGAGKKPSAFLRSTLNLEHPTLDLERLPGRAGCQTCGIAGFQTLKAMGSAADLGVGDTAGLATCATGPLGCRESAADWH
jgi:hypothetical protein